MIPCRMQQTPACLIKLALSGIVRQAGIFISALSWLQPRHVRVAITSNTVRPQLNYLPERFSYRLHRLERQAIDQIKPNRIIPNFPAGLYRRFDILKRLYTMYRRLYRKIEILYPIAHAAKAQVEQRLQ